MSVLADSEPDLFGPDAAKSPLSGPTLHKLYLLYKYTILITVHYTVVYSTAVCNNLLSGCDLTTWYRERGEGDRRVEGGGGGGGGANNGIACNQCCITCNPLPQSHYRNAGGPAGGQNLLVLTLHRTQHQKEQQYRDKTYFAKNNTWTHI